MSMKLFVILAVLGLSLASRSDSFLEKCDTPAYLVNHNHPNEQKSTELVFPDDIWINILDPSFYSSVPAISCVSKYLCELARKQSLAYLTDRLALQKYSEEQISGALNVALNEIKSADEAFMLIRSVGSFANSVRICEFIASKSFAQNQVAEALQKHEQHYFFPNTTASSCYLESKFVPGTSLCPEDLARGRTLVP